MHVFGGGNLGRLLGELMFLAYGVARIQPAELARGQELAGLFDQFPLNHGGKLPGGVLPKTTSLERLQLTPTNNFSYKQLPMRLFSQLLVQRFGTRTRCSAIAISLTWQHGRPQSCEVSCRRAPCRRSRRSKHPAARHQVCLPLHGLGHGAPMTLG